MKPAPRLLGLFAVPALALALWCFWPREGAAPSVVQPAVPQAETPEAAPVRAAGTADPTAPAVRQPIEPASPGIQPQGFSGVLVDGSGTPVAGARLALVRGLDIHDMFSAIRAIQQRRPAQVESAAMSDAAGRFQLPCSGYGPRQAFDLRIEHPRLVVAGQRTGLRAVEGQYTDLGYITLKPGMSVTGRVTIEGSGGAPVPGACVRLSQGNGVSFLRMPGHEGGIEVRCDPTGQYRFDNVEAGSIELDASARGYALVRKSNILVQDNQQPTTVDFELGKGFALAGFVTDAQGQPIANAQVTGDAISTKNPMTLTRVTDKSGAFELLGLAEGQYALAAEADGFVKADRRGPFQAGETNAQLVLEKQGAVRVFVTSSSGAALRRYTLEVKRFFPAQPETFGPVPDKFPVEVRSAPATGYVLEGLDPESYVVMVEAPEHSKKYSEPFTVLQGGEGPEVRVQLGRGGTITGRVVARGGQPVANAAILTRPNALDENPLFELIPFFHKRITEAQVVTGNDGRFQLQLLIPDTYQLRITHKDHYRTNRKGIQVAESQVTDLGDVELHAGVRVKGVVYVNGQPRAGVEVSLSAAHGTGLGYYAEKALSDDRGRFALDNPLPPGQYEATACRTNVGPFDKIADFTRSRKMVTLVEGTANPDLVLELDHAK